MRVLTADGQRRLAVLARQIPGARHHDLRRVAAVVMGLDEHDELRSLLIAGAYSEPAERAAAWQEICQALAAEGESGRAIDCLDLLVTVGGVLEAADNEGAL
ncbi:hypothetical protein FSW04_16185 [Baekduia soli]|uniref:Uncharacterized protein n=1 Tax=Baekduia soli TaxID=496014 RepID=A0A5B8U821_9ACTN|nr:hypothetical protein [Baekduia soli]QEC48958.1 hypothetical protein FSW04_16185 [Baekduia soli]